MKGLRLSAEVATKVFKPTSTISVKLKLENTSEARVYIHKQLGFASGGFRIAILDSDKRWAPPNFIPETFPTPVLSQDDLQAIEPCKSD